MAIKLIAIDMDGTLLNPQHEVTAAVKSAIGRARDRSSAGWHRALFDGTRYAAARSVLHQ